MKSTEQPYFVLADAGLRRNVLGYGVYFNPVDQPLTNVQVDEGYFAIEKGKWRVALCAANALRDKLNAAEGSS